MTKLNASEGRFFVQEIIKYGILLITINCNGGILAERQIN